MELLAGLLGGLGLFLIGIRALGRDLQGLAGPRMRLTVARLTARPATGATMGLLLGALTQSSNAVTFIAANMLASGLLTTARALPVLAWANPGTAALVLLTAVDLRLAALLLLGVAGIASYLGLDGGGRWRAGYGAAIGLGLLLLGLTQLKFASAPLRDMPVMLDILAFAGEAALPPLILGAVITLVTQSSSAVTILAIALQAAGLLSFEQALLAMAGASIGSGLAVLALSGAAGGSTRQLVLFQFGFKLLAALLFLALIGLESATGVPLLRALAGQVSAAPEVQLGLLFALMQLSAAALLAPLGRPVQWLLARLSPPSPTEALGRPAFLYDQALADPASALDLAAREQDRLRARLPLLLEAVREGAADPVGSAALSLANAQVEAALDEFLGRLLAQAPSGELLLRAVRLNARTRLLRDLRLATAEFAQDAAAAGGAAPLPQLTEALHLLLSQLAEMADDEDAATLLALTGERGAMMRRLRAGGGEEAAGLLHRATACFERAVWLIRSLLEAEEAR